MQVKSGTGEDTMAMQVALESGIPKDVVLQASRLHDALIGLGRDSFISGGHIVLAAGQAGFMSAQHPTGEMNSSTESRAKVFLDRQQKMS